MKKLSFAVVGAAALALAACGGKGDDSLAENVQENYENAAENLDAAADNTANAAEADALENQADALREEGEAKEEAIDKADVNAGPAPLVPALFCAAVPARATRHERRRDSRRNPGRLARLHAGP
jgi:hypothetical protein